MRTKPAQQDKGCSDGKIAVDSAFDNRLDSLTTH